MRNRTSTIKQRWGFDARQNQIRLMRQSHIGSTSSTKPTKQNPTDKCNFLGLSRRFLRGSVELGVRCSACHQRDSDEVAPGGPPGPRFADDSKPMEQVARLMYTMTLEINRKYIVGQDGVPGPVTCGTCHHGSMSPEPFVPPRIAPGALIQPSASTETPAPQSNQ